MGNNSQNPSRAELRRRHEQSLRDRELHQRRLQSARDRARHQQEQARARRQQQQAQEARRRRELIQITREGVSDLRRQLTTTITLPVSPPTSEAMSRRSLPSQSGQKSTPKTTFHSLFNNKKYSDTTLYLGVSKILFPAHQLVLGLRSPYFDDALQSEFKEGKTHEFVFEKDSPYALWRVLEYIYTGDYVDALAESLDSEEDDLELFKHPRVYALADMFRMEDLKSLSCSKFAAQLENNWRSDTFFDCIREVYLTSYESADIRKVVVDIVSSHTKELAEKEPFRELIREVGDFAVDLVVKLAESPW